MPKFTVETLAARLDVQAIAVQELARALTPAQADTVADAARRRVADLADEGTSGMDDAAIAGELAYLLRALTR